MRLSGKRPAANYGSVAPQLTSSKAPLSAVASSHNDSSPLLYHAMAANEDEDAFHSAEEADEDDVVAANGGKAVRASAIEQMPVRTRERDGARVGREAGPG